MALVKNTSPFLLPLRPKTAISFEELHEKLATFKVQLKQDHGTTMKPPTIVNLASKPPYHIR